jgi:pSer/pThr/pTyr-binding forkhead associated (FHA) protein
VAQQAPAQTYQPAPQPAVAVAARPANFGETTVLSNVAAGATTVLGVDPASQVATPHLIRTKNNERINLNKPVFRIGKEKSFVDYFIGDNTAISRSHADFTTRDGEYYVTDMNSTNHTYVNGAMIQSSVEVKLVHGTKIKLANEEFEFKLY